MTTTNKKKTTTNTKKVKSESKKNLSVIKKRLIVSYDKLSEKDKDLFEEKYEDGFMDYVQTVTRPGGNPMFVVPLETEENIYMVKIDLRVDSKMSDEEFEKEVFRDGKSEQDEITTLVNSEKNRGVREFRLNHGDYSSTNSIEESVAKEDMNKANFTSLEDIDVADENSVDL
ncbi:MAG: hypothetical protein ACTTJH_03635 [Bacteroidales bacterium]